MPDLAKSAQKLSRKWFFSVVGLIILVILAFWYLNATNLFPNLFKTPDINNSPLVHKAAAAGYKIAWLGDPNDTTGRTLLAEGQRGENLLPDKFYWALTYDKNLKLFGFSHGIGIFERWEKIPDSKDYLIVLKNPLPKFSTQKKLTARIIIDDTKISTKTAVVMPTTLVVENLDYGFKNKNASPAEDYGNFVDIGESTLIKLIKPGDVVVIYSIFLNEDQAKAQRKLNLTDERKIPYALTISVRRFGGLEELRKEL